MSHLCVKFIWSLPSLSTQELNVHGSVTQEKNSNMDIGYTFNGRYFAEAVIWSEKVNKVAMREHERYCWLIFTVFQN